MSSTGLITVESSHGVIFGQYMAMDAEPQSVLLWLTKHKHFNWAEFIREVDRLPWHSVEWAFEQTARIAADKFGSVGCESGQLQLNIAQWMDLASANPHLTPYSWVSVLGRYRQLEFRVDWHNYGNPEYHYRILPQDNVLQLSYDQAESCSPLDRPEKLELELRHLGVVQ